MIDQTITHYKFIHELDEGRIVIVYKVHFPNYTTFSSFL